MFESAELGHRLGKAVFRETVPGLRENLLAAQVDLAERAEFPVVLLIGGVDGAGKGDTVNTLNYWMDPRLIRTHAMGAPTQEEAERPPMWRFWRALPPKGRIGIFFGSWYTAPIVDRAYGRTGDGDLEKSIEEILRFEAMLASEGALVLKYWLHLGKKVQRKRLKALERDPNTRWRVTPTDWQHFKLYDTFRGLSERALRLTSTPYAPWIVVEGTDPLYRMVTVGTSIHEALRARLDNTPPRPPETALAPIPKIDDRNVLRALDTSRRLSKRNYHDRMEVLQGRLNQLSRHRRMRKHGAVLVFEGADAAGKGGAIRRVTGALDARFYRIIPVAAPTDEERAQPYLWRFWRHLPRRGHFTIFDRSWYGRVLVERVEGFCSENDWARAYGEINDFEEEMSRHGLIVAKYWLHVSPDEQLRRFEERERTGYKRFKLTEEDWRNRDKRQAYEDAVCDMVDRTSTMMAPWHLIASDDKYHARIEVLRILCDTIEAALKA
jgi:polyphosphate:AMP phosphotransferase